ncbi:uncharacterized protein N7477_001906 [Penicillium maclennaniae]|uniref:uncharacterized protein n=1 Tax=Penicillium maclennaniae TaxID=1343394 RepID=UPI00253F6F58|nr:uncharacterized protein N7477_001906 [Penicillium maclennaniae]KAJ5681966.1 hypothetical protein N7477_001906 [Penicillium maclennaniae]
MAFTAGQARAIEITERVGSSISLLCSCSVIATFFFTKHDQTPVQRLIFFATWGNVWSNIGMLIALSGISRGEDSALCQFQAFLIQWFPPADAFWSLCMALDIFLTCFRRYDMTMLRRLEWKYFLFSYGTPFIPAVVFLFIETSTKGKVYGSAFVRESNALNMSTIDWRILYLVVYYVPIWIANILTISIYIWTGREIIQSRKQLQHVVFDAESPEHLPDGTSGSSVRRLMSSHDAGSEFLCQNTSQSGAPLIMLLFAYHAVATKLSLPHISYFPRKKSFLGVKYGSYTGHRLAFCKASFNVFHLNATYMGKNHSKQFLP